MPTEPDPEFEQPVSSTTAEPSESEEHAYAADRKAAIQRAAVVLAICVVLWLAVMILAETPSKQPLSMGWEVVGAVVVLASTYGAALSLTYLGKLMMRPTKSGQAPEPETRDNRKKSGICGSAAGGMLVLYGANTQPAFQSPFYWPFQGLLLGLFLWGLLLATGQAKVVESFGKFLRPQATTHVVPVAGSIDPVTNPNGIQTEKLYVSYRVSSYSVLLMYWLFARNRRILLILTLALWMAICTTAAVVFREEKGWQVVGTVTTATIEILGVAALSVIAIVYGQGSLARLYDVDRLLIIGADGIRTESPMRNADTAWMAIRAIEMDYTNLCLYRNGDDTDGIFINLEPLPDSKRIRLVEAIKTLWRSNGEKFPNASVMAEFAPQATSIPSESAP